MPFQTNTYKLEVFGLPDDGYSASADRRRSYTLENQLVSQLDIFGGGVIRGLNVFSSTDPSKPFDIILEEGLAVVPFDFKNIIVDGAKTTEVIERHHIAVRLEERNTFPVNPNTVTGIFIFAPDSDRMKGTFTILSVSNLIRNTTTTTGEPRSHLDYVIDGNIPMGFNVRVLINSKEVHGGYTLQGNTLSFKSKRLPSDIVTVRIEPHNSLLLSVITSDNDHISLIDNSVRINLKDRVGDEIIGDQIRSHKHSEAPGSPSKIILTTSTNYKRAESANENNTLYRVSKEELIEGTAMSEEWMSRRGTSSAIYGNTLFDSHASFLMGNKVDRLKGYYLNPNTNQKRFISVVSNSSNQLVANDNLEPIASSGDSYLLLPYEVQVAVNGKEEYYGYHLLDDDNEYVYIQFNGSLESSDYVDVKLLYTRQQSEIQGIITLDSESSRVSTSRSINFSGDNFKSGFISQDRIPELDHTGRTKEVAFPSISTYGRNGSGWKTDTFDCITYRPRTDNVNSIRNVEFIHEHKGYFYLCANNTLLRVRGSRLFDHEEMEFFSYPDIYKPTKIIEQYTSETLYALTSKVVLTLKGGSWDEFVNITSDRVESNHPYLTNLIGYSNLKDITSDSGDRLFLVADNSLLMFNPVYSRTKNWYKITTPSNFALSNVVIWEHDDNYAIFISGENSKNIWVSNNKIARLAKDALHTSTQIVLHDVAGFNIGDEIIIIDTESDPHTRIISEISENTIKFSLPLEAKFISGRSMVLKQFKKIDLSEPENVVSMHINSDKDLVVNSGNSLQLIHRDDILAKTYASDTIDVSLGGSINSYGYKFGHHYVGIKDYGLFIHDNGWKPLLNNKFDTSLNSYVQKPLYIHDSQDDEIYIGCEDGIVQMSEKGHYDQELIFRNASIYLGRPLDAGNNVFKTRLGTGTVGVRQPDDSTLISTGERGIYVNADLKEVSNGDYLLFTPTGGGSRVGKYLRILSITAISEPRRQYLVNVDNFDGSPLNIEEIRFGETFDIIPSILPLPIINGIPQDIQYAENINDFDFDFATQNISFSSSNSYSDDVVVATKFDTFTPARGRWDSEKDVAVYLNGRDISNISGSWLKISKVNYFDPSTSLTSVKTRLFAQNTLFRNLNLKGITFNVNASKDLKYVVESNNESSITLGGDFYDVITNSGADQASEINFSLSLVDFDDSEDGYHKAIKLASPVILSDHVNITIKNVYLDAGKLSHEELEDNFSEEHTGFHSKLDATRNSNLLQLYSGLKKFISSIPEDLGVNIEHIDFSKEDVFDLINSTVENHKVYDSEVEDSEVAFNVFGLLHSSTYGGIYALTEKGVFFKPDPTTSNPSLRWNKLTDFFDTLNAQGIKEPDPDSPGGFYIGFDKKTNMWKVSWGGFHDSEKKNSGLSDIKVVDTYIDSQNPNRFYLATENHGILKTEDDGKTFRSVFNASSFGFENNKIIQLKFHPTYPTVAHLVTENGLYRTIDGCENFELLIDHETEGATYQEKPRSIELFTGPSGNEFKIYYGAGSLYYRDNFTEVSPGQEFLFNRLSFSDITFEDTFDLIINDIKVNPVNEDHIYLATNNGVYRTLSGVGRDREFYVIEARDAFENGAAFSYITIDAALSHLDIPIGTYVLPNKLNPGRTFEVVDIEIQSTFAIVKVKGTSVRSAAKPQVKPGDIFVAKRWGKFNAGLNDLDIVSIDFSPLSNTIVCGTRASGAYLCVNDIDWELVAEGMSSDPLGQNISISKIRVIGYDIYASVRQNNLANGGLYKLDQSFKTWFQLSSHDVLSFYTDGAEIIVGTSDGAYRSSDSGANWSRVIIPSDNVLALDWMSDSLSSVAGTGGMGLFFGSSLGDHWKQQFSQASILTEIKALSWRILDIQEDKSDPKSPLKITIQPISNNLNEKSPKDSLDNYIQESLTTGDYEWIPKGSTPISPTKSIWLDPCNYSYMSNQDLKSSLLNKEINLGFLHNGFIQDPYASERFLTLLNDHQVQSNEYKNVNGYVLSRQGGVIISDSKLPDSFQGSNITPSRSERVNSLRSFKVNDLIGDHSGNIFVATENAGVFKITPNTYAETYFGQGVVDGLEFTNEDLNLLTLDVDGNYIDLVSWSNIHSSTISHASGSTFNLQSSPGDGVYSYAISSVRILEVNGEKNFKEARVKPTFALGSTSDYSSSMQDKVVMITSKSTFQTLPEIGTKIYISPHLSARTDYRSANTPFIVSSAQITDSGAKLELTIGSYDIEFKSGESLIRVTSASHNDTGDNTTLTLAEAVPVSVMNWSNFRFQPNINLNVVTTANYVSGNTVTFNDPDGSIYNALMASGDNPFYCRFNYGLTFMEGNVERIPYLQAPSTVSELHFDLESYKNEYSEYKANFVKLLYETNLYAAVQPVGIMKFDGTSWSKLSGFEDKHPIDLDWSSESGTMFVCTRDKVYFSDDLNSWTDITPDVNVPKFNSLKCVSGSDSECYLATEFHGIYYTSDKGNSWTPLNEGMDINTCPQWKFAQDQKDTSIVFAYGFDSGVFKRTTGFNHEDSVFKDVNKGILNKNISDLWVSRHVGYAATATGGIFKTTDGAESWTPVITSSFDSNIIKNIVSFPENTDMVFCIAQTDNLSALSKFGRPSGENLSSSRSSANALYKSIDGGVTWEKVIDVDTRFVTELISVPGGSLFVGTRNAIYKSSDYGESIEVALEGNFKNVYSIVNTVGKKNELIATMDEGIVAISFDLGETWSTKSTSANTPSLDISSVADPSPITMVSKQVITYSNPTPIKGYVSGINLDTFKISGNNSTYYDFSGARIRLTNGSEYELESIESTISLDSGFKISNLESTGLKEGDYCEVFGFSKILIYNPNPEHVLLGKNKSLWVNLHIQIGNQSPLKIAQYTYDPDQNAIVIVVIGRMDADLNGVYSAKVGHLNDGIIDPPTNIFFTSMTRYFEYAPSITLNYFDSFISYNEDIHLRQSESVTADAYGLDSIKTGWEDIDNNTFYLLSDKNITTVNKNDNSHPEVSRYVLDETLTQRGILLRNGFAKGLSVCYVSKSDGVYTNSNPESNGAWNKIADNSYFGQQGIKNFSSILFPLTISPSDKNHAYMVVDDHILLQTNNLSSWGNSLNPVWYEKSLRLTDQDNFDSSWVKSIKIHPSNPKVLFVCVDAEGNIEKNGLYLSKDSGATWTKVFVGPDSNAAISDLCFLDNTGDKMLVSSIRDDGSDLYVNILGTASDDTIGAILVSESIVLSASKFGISLINREKKTGEHLLFSEDIRFIKDSDSYVFVGTSNSISVILRTSLEGGIIQKHSIKEIIFPNSSSINNTYTKDGRAYFCTDKGVYYCNYLDLSEEVSLNKLKVIPESIGYETTDIIIDENNETWISTRTGLIRISGEEHVVYNSSNSPVPDNILCLGYTPRAIAMSQNRLAELFIPRAPLEEDVLIVKSYGRSPVDQVVNSKKYFSRVSGTVNSMVYNAETDTTEIITEDISLNEEEEIVGRVAIFDGNFDDPRTITLSTEESFEVSGFIQNGSQVYIYDTVAESDYILYSGGVFEDSFIDRDVINNKLFCYDVYYAVGGEYVFSFSFSLTPDENRITSSSTATLFIGTDSGAYTYSYDKREFNKILNNSQVYKFINDNYFNSYAVTARSIVKCTESTQQTIYTDNDLISNAVFNSTEMIVSTNAGVKFIRSSVLDDLINSSYLVYDVIGGDNYFLKVYSTEGDTISSLFLSEGNANALSGSRLYAPEKSWFGFRYVTLEPDTNRPLVGAIGGEQGSTLIFGSRSIFYKKADQDFPIRLFTPIGSHSLTAPFTSYFCDGRNLLTSMSEPRWASNGEIHFCTFKLNNQMYYTNYNESVNAFNNGTGLACNSHNGITYSGITCLDIDQDNNLWVGAKGNIYIRPSGSNIWVKMGFEHIGKNTIYESFINGTTTIGNLQNFIPISISKMNAPSGENGVVVSIISNRSMGFHSGDDISTMDNEFNSALKTTVYSYFVKYELGSFSGYLLSEGIYEEHDPYIFSRNIDKINPWEEGYGAIIKSRTRPVNIHNNIFSPIFGNDHYELQKLLMPRLFDHSRDSGVEDIGARIGIESDYRTPWAYGRRTLESKVGIVESYRPFRSIIAEYDINNPDIIYIVIFNPGSEYTDGNISQLYKTVDGGLHWFETNIEGDLFTYGKISDLFVEGDNIYLSFVSDFEEYSGIYFSSDGGYSFENITGNLPSNPVSCIYKSGDTLYAGVLGLGLYKSTSPDVWVRDEPRFTQRIGLGLSNGYIEDLDVHDKNPKIIYAATRDSGVIKSLDGGNNWQFDVSGLPSLSCTAVKISPFSESTVWLGTSQGFYYKNETNRDWTLSADIQANESIKLIACNGSLRKNVVSLSYIIPDLSAQGILILRKEQYKISYVPQDGSVHATNSGAGDAFVIYDGPLPSHDSGLVRLQDEKNIKPGIDYYYDFYTYTYDNSESSLKRVYTKFPDVFSYEVKSFTDTTISINTEISGEVESAVYNSSFEVTIIENPSRISSLDSSTHFGPELVGKKIKFNLTDSSSIESVITDAYYGTIHISEDYAEKLIGASFVIDLGIHGEYSDHIINPNIHQLQTPSSNGQEINFSIKYNTDSTITIKESGISRVPNMGEISFDNFGNKHSTQFAITSSKAVRSTTISPLYVVTDNGLYFSMDNGINFSKINLDSIENDNINYIEFLNQENIIDINETKAYLAGSNGLYYTKDHFASFLSDKTHQDGAEYNYVKPDANDPKIVYVIKNGELHRSIDGGIYFTPLKTDLDDQDINEIISLQLNTNYMLCGTKGNGITLVKDSVRDEFNINLDTEVAFEKISYEKLKIGDEISTDVNSLSISSVLRPNSMTNEISSVEFYVPKGRYIKAQINYNGDRADTSIIHIGEDQFNPSSNPFRLRVPGSSNPPSVGFSLIQLPDNMLIATTNKGAYYSKNGKIWTKIDNFLIPDTVYSATQLQNGNIYLGTNNGAWLNKTSDIINFSPKDQLGRKVKAFWSHKEGSKSITFIGGEEGLRIKFQNYPNIIITTPQNFNKDDGISLSWGEERDDGSYNPGGLDDILLSHLNAERKFEDPCAKGTSTKIVTANGWSGIVLVRYEGQEDSGFSPSNQTIYEKGDRRYIDSIRQKEFDITPEDADVGSVVKTVFGFPDGLVVVDNIRAAKDRHSTGVTSGPDQDTFTPDNPFVDNVSITPYDDAVDEFGANPGAARNPDETYITKGAELKPDTTYTYTLFAYYLRPPNYVFESTENGCAWIPIYSKVNIKEYNVNIPISHFPNATTITCGAALSETHYVVGTDDGLFYSKTNAGFRKSPGTDNNIINCILVYDPIQKSILIGTNNGIFISTNGEDGFTKVFDNVANNVRMVFSLTADDNGDIYAGTDRGVFKKDSVDNTVWNFESIVGTADTAPPGKVIGQSFTIDEN